MRPGLFCTEAAKEKKIMNNQTFEQAADFIESIPRFTKKNTPEVTRNYLDLLGSPDEGMRIIHVAGTNGKGSVCLFLSKILQAAGYRTALFTSPHLVTIRERMAIDGEMISEEQFLHYEETVERASRHSGLPHPAYFEFLFLMAMLWFRDRKPDFVVLETGLGGRLDATNTVRDKELTVITRIGRDHMQYLGDTIPQIAAEKAGIIREGTPVICLEEPEEAFVVIRRTAADRGAEMISVSHDSFTGSPSGDNFIDFSCLSRYDNNDCPGGARPVPFHGKISSRALFQCENAALAVQAVRCLQGRGVRIPEEALHVGLSHSFWPGRMEECGPGIWIDGAHNADGIRAFLESVRTIVPPEGRTRKLLFSAVSDKEYKKELRMIFDSGLFSEVVTAPVESGRSVSERQLDEAADEADKKGILHKSCRDPKEGFRQLVADRDPGDLIFAAGSLYLAADLKKQGELN